jgi:hypothetical protein
VRKAYLPNEATAKFISAYGKMGYEKTRPSRKPNQSHRKPVFGGEGMIRSLPPVPARQNSRLGSFGNWQSAIGNWKCILLR